MFTPTVANYISFFYAVGNTPAINLTKNLPHGIDANLLLLGCGDVRNILHTSYHEDGLPSRKLDITINDIDEAVLARNIFLLSLLLDNSASGNTPWNLYYNLHLDKKDLSILASQVKKLISASESLKSWKASSYGNVLPFCDQATLDDVRAIWVTYDAAAKSDDTSVDSAALVANMKHSLDTKNTAFGGGVSYTGLRSAAPVSLQFSQQIVEASEEFWKSAAAGPSGVTSHPNPLFYASLTEHHLLHYGTDPILGFHLAAAFLRLTDKSPLKPDQKDEDSKVFAAAKTQFREWATACGTMLRAKRLVIRSVASEALALCQTFQHYAVTQETSAGWYRRQFDARILALDSEAYGSKPSAPAAFDTIDTSNLADHFGTLNILISALPLLAAQPWSAVFTETLLRTEDTTKEAFDKLLYGHGRTISLLLGASPVEYWTNATATSSVDEVLIGLSTNSIQSTKDTLSQVHNRVTWKQSKHFSGVSSKSPLKIDPEALANIFFRLYLDIFAHENPMKLLSISKASTTQLIRNSAYSHFHRGTLVSLLRYLKFRLSVTDFDVTCRLLIEKICAERSLMFTGNLRQDLSLQMHTQGVFSEPWLRQEIKPNRKLGGFDSWEHVPEVVAVSLVVPRESFNRVYAGSGQAKMSAPTIRGSLISGENANHQWHNFYDEVQLVFGNIITSGDRESSDFSVVVKADPAGWLGNSPLIASFYVPAAALQMERKTAYARLEVVSSAQSAAVFSQTLGHELKIFQAKLGDEDSVFITKHMPGQTMYPAASDAAATVAESDVEPKNETASIFTADVSKNQDRVETITGHLDFFAEKEKKLLADKVPIAIKQASPFTINIVFGDKEHIYPLTFPTPVDASKAKTRIARKSAYIEVVAPFAVPPTQPQTKTALDDFVFPTYLARSLSNTPADLNTPHLNLDRLPIIDLSGKEDNRWITTLLSFVFSVSERVLREEVNAGRQALSPSPRLNFKESIFTMAMLSSGQQGGQTGLFCLNHPDRGGIHMLVLVSAIRLDAAAASIILDAAVLPMTIPLVKKCEPFLLLLRELEMCSVTVNDDELVFWKKALPALAERSRTWNHKSSCEYRKTGSIPLSLEPSEPVLCSCGNGHFPDNFIGLPEWETAAKYATRIAISPTFAVPLVEDIVDTDLYKRSGSVVPPQQERCRSCGKTGKDGVALKKCMRCLNARYCSPECQKKDWRKHRGECEESERYHKTLTLEHFHDPSAVKYAIRSRNWEEEVTFQDMACVPKAKRKAGFAKIASACKMALETEGLGYAWVDTCCIDKNSSADLSEAINSMFQWYRRADVCFVLLSNLPPKTRPQPSPAWPFRRPPEDAAALRVCRWLSRGWTLQELMAPTYVKFYDAGWQYWFTKDGEASTLSAITSIDHDVLALKKELTAVPVAVKMFWASRRKTTRVEGQAYPLLGLFDIDTPMLYGEGHKAFQRLQDEIVKETDDTSLFAWLAERGSKQLYRGAFAGSPSEFAHCATLEQRRSRMDMTLTPFSITNRGVSFKVIVFSSVPEDRLCMDLGCRTGGICRRCGTEHTVHVGLQHTADGWVRKSPTECWLVNKPAATSREWEICVRKRSKEISKFPVSQPVYHRLVLWS